MGRNTRLFPPDTGTFVQILCCEQITPNQSPTGGNRIQDNAEGGGVFLTRFDHLVYNCLVICQDGLVFDICF